jgi:hypothetical protein
MTISFSGRMHCWFMPVIRVHDHLHVLLRGVNWRGEYDDNPIHFHQKFPWWHVPSSKFAYDPEKVPSTEETLRLVMPVLREEWPAIAHGKIVAADQDREGRWGGVSLANEIETVTRIAIDLGTAATLPEVVLRPGQKLPWPRHPTVWIRADRVSELADTSEGETGVKNSPFIVGGEQRVSLETDGGLREMAVSDLRLKQSAGVMFTNAFGPIFSRER